MNLRNKGFSLAIMVALATAACGPTKDAALETGSPEADVSGAAPSPSSSRCGNGTSREELSAITDAVFSSPLASKLELSSVTNNLEMAVNKADASAVVFGEIVDIVPVSEAQFPLPEGPDLPHEVVWSGYEVTVSNGTNSTTVAVPLDTGAKGTLAGKSRNLHATADLARLRNSCAVALVGRGSGAFANTLLAVSSSPDEQPVPFGPHLEKAVASPSLNAVAEAARERVDRKAQ